VILLVTAIERASECAVCLQQETGEPVLIAQNLLEAAVRLRAASYTLVIFDQHLIEVEPNEYGTVCAHLEDASWLEVNFAITGPERLAGQAQWALKRRARDEAAFRAAAIRRLRGELSDAVSTILFECQIALELPNIAPEAAERLEAIREAALEIRARLEVEETGQS